MKSCSRTHGPRICNVLSLKFTVDQRESLGIVRMRSTLVASSSLISLQIGEKAHIQPSMRSAYCYIMDLLSSRVIEPCF